MTFLTLIILSLACYRLTHLIVFDLIFAPIRNLFVKRDFSTMSFYLQGGPIRRFIGSIVNCFWCTGLWISFILTIAYFQTFNLSVFLQALAVAAIASLIETAWMKSVGFPEMRPGTQPKAERKGVHPSELVGKIALRTEPHKTTGDRSFCSTPITILAVSKSHILYRWEGSFRKGISNPDEPRILASDYLDENWTSYDDLMKLAEPNFLVRLLKKIKQISSKEENKNV
jgi:hypothetical protein